MFHKHPRNDIENPAGQITLTDYIKRLKDRSVGIYGKVKVSTDPCVICNKRGDAFKFVPPIKDTKQYMIACEKCYKQVWAGEK